VHFDEKAFKKSGILKQMPEKAAIRQSGNQMPDSGHKK